MISPSLPLLGSLVLLDGLRGDGRCVLGELGFFGGDHDHAVSTLGSVDSRRLCIFFMVVIFYFANSIQARMSGATPLGSSSRMRS